MAGRRSEHAAHVFREAVHDEVRTWRVGPSNSTSARKPIRKAVLAIHRMPLVMPLIAAMMRPSIRFDGLSAMFSILWMPPPDSSAEPASAEVSPATRQ